MVLERLPLTPHGKVDRQALPAPDDCRSGHTTRFVAPADDLERQLASICESILGVHPVGVEDNLFDLGLDSLKALRLIEQCERRLGSHLPPATLFASPTLAQLAVAVRESSVRETWSSLLPIQPEGDRPPFFWIHGDCSNPYLSRYLGPDQPLYALEHQSQDGRPARYSEVATIAGYYIQEMRKVQRTGPYYVGGYSFGGIVALEVAQQLTHKGEHVGLLALLDPPSLLTARKDAMPPPRTRTLPTVSALSRHSESLAVLTPAEQLAYLRVPSNPEDRTHPEAASARVDDREAGLQIPAGAGASSVGVRSWLLHSRHLHRYVRPIRSQAVSRAGASVQRRGSCVPGRHRTGNSCWGTTAKCTSCRQVTRRCAMNGVCPSGRTGSMPPCRGRNATRLRTRSRGRTPAAAVARACRLRGSARLSLLLDASPLQRLELCQV